MCICTNKLGHLFIDMAKILVYNKNNLKKTEFNKDDSNGACSLE